MDEPTKTVQLWWENRIDVSIKSEQWSSLSNFIIYGGVLIGTWLEEHVIKNKIRSSKSKVYKYRKVSFCETEKLYVLFVQRIYEKGNTVKLNVVKH